VAKGRPPLGRRKKMGLETNSLVTGTVEEDESNVDEEMEEETVLNGDDVVMKEVAMKADLEPIRVIPNDKPVLFGDTNTVVAAWNGKSLLATGYGTHSSGVTLDTGVASKCGRSCRVRNSILIRWIFPHLPPET
jgi:hypothetical protein